ncbi:ESX-1 secretion-associated protein EspJ [Mycobacterium simulans]|uniref:ESX-1 secretion-associated protein EspJ n=1 Tax=Mycobacterium simulans TaxID=627089 RepID=A0A7Z7IQK9_9MYCO|nr:ESX-1 secretion-associated protein EspJ [Mycobacterium simulans]
MTETLTVDSSRLSAAGAKLAGLVFPTLPAPIAATGSDPISAAINATMPRIESLVDEGLPGAKAALTKTGTSMATAAEVYAKADQSFAESLKRYQFGSNGSISALSCPARPVFDLINAPFEKLFGRPLFPFPPAKPGDPGMPVTPGKKATDAARDKTLEHSQGGPIKDPKLGEISGIVYSKKNPNVVWVHNDSGDGARIYAIDARTGETLGTYELKGIKAKDIEDISIGPGPEPGKSYLYVADIGDNGHSRNGGVTVHRIEEPTVTGTAAHPTNTKLSDVETFTLKYPNGPRDAEAFMVDPRTGDMLIIEKNYDGNPAIYRVSGDLEGGSTTTLQKVGTLQLPPGGSYAVTGADISPDGSQIAVRTYGKVLLWDRDPSADVWTALEEKPVTGPRPDEKQGEAIAFHPDGRGYTTISEGKNQPLNHYRAK